MRTRLLLIATVALASGGATFAYVSQAAERLIVTTPVVVPAAVIPPYAMISADDLTTKDVPRSLLSEPIYTEASQLIGKVSTVPLLPGSLIYHHFAVPAADFRLAADPALEVIAFPVSVPAAVGGEVRAGQLINIYRAVVSPSIASAVSQALISEGAAWDIQQLLDTQAAAAELLAGDVLVVAVQSGQGRRVGPDEAAASDERDRRDRQLPVEVITVAVPPDVAREIVRLVAEAQAHVQLWVSLAPLGGAVPVAEAQP